MDTVADTSGANQPKTGESIVGKNPESEPKFTPGPWQWGHFDGRIQICPDWGGVIATVRRLNSVVGLLPAEANARLMSAAPDLLAACRQALAMLTYKPKRETRLPMPDEPGFREAVTADCQEFADRWDAAESTLRKAIDRAEGRA